MQVKKYSYKQGKFVDYMHIYQFNIA